MNVLVLTSQFYAPSGAESLQIELALDLASRSGTKVILMAMGDPTDSKVITARTKLEDKGVRVEMLKLRIHPNLFLLWRAASMLRKWLIAENIDIIETSLYTPSIVAALASQGLKIPLVHGVHAPFYKDMVLGRLNARKHFWKLVLRRKHVFFYSISDFVGRCWKDFFKVSPNRIRRIYNSISDRYFQAQNCRKTLCKELGIDTSEKLILFVGRIRPDKGVELLLEAMEPRDLEFKTHLIFIGAVEPEYAELGKRLDTLSRCKNSRVHHLGYRNDIANWYASVDVFVLPTQREGFGMVIMEALAAGCPTISTTVDALPEIYSDSGAILVAPHSISAFRQAIKNQLVLNSQERNALSKHSRHFATYFKTTYRTDRLLEYMQFCRHQMQE